MWAAWFSKPLKHRNRKIFDGRYRSSLRIILQINCLFIPKHNKNGSASESSTSAGKPPLPCIVGQPEYSTMPALTARDNIVPSSRGASRFRQNHVSCRRHLTAMVAVMRS